MLMLAQPSELSGSHHGRELGGVIMEPRVAPPTTPGLDTRPRAKGAYQLGRRPDHPWCAQESTTGKPQQPRAGMTSRNDLERLISTTATTSDASPFRTAIRNVIAASRSSPLALAAYCKEGVVPALATSLTQVRASPWGMPGRFFLRRQAGVVATGTPHFPTSILRRLAMHCCCCLFLGR